MWSLQEQCPCADLPCIYNRPYVYMVNRRAMDYRYSQEWLFPFAVVLTVYIKKEKEKAYHAVMLDTLTAYDFKIEVCQCLFEMTINSILL